MHTFVTQQHKTQIVESECLLQTDKELQRPTSVTKQKKCQRCQVCNQVFVCETTLLQTLRLGKVPLKSEELLFINYEVIQI